MNCAKSILPAAKEERTLLHKAHRFLKMAAESHLTRFHCIGNHFSEERKQRLYSDDFFEIVSHLNSENILETDFARSHGAKMSDRILHLDINRYLQDDILVKTDRASMHSGLELRSPFMDHRVIEFASSLPYHYKRNADTGKHILKETFKDFLPEGLTKLSKKGFAVPLGRWFRGPMKEMAHDLLLDKTSQDRGIFNHKSIEQLLKEHDSNKNDHGQP